MKALITGASGFIGLNLVRRLLNDNWEVCILLRNKKSIKKFSNKRIKIFYGDLTNFNSLNKKMTNVDVVFNLAGALPYHHLSENDYWQINTEGVRNMLDICKNSKIKRFVHVSTTGIYGSTTYANEKSTLHLDSAYAKSKAAGEKLVYSYYKNERLPITIIRPTIAFGEGDTRPGFFNLFPLIKKRIFIPVGNGRNFFHTIYVGNLVEALILAATKKEAIGEDFIIGDEPCSTMEQIIKTIAKIEGVTIWPFYIPQKLGYIMGKFFDITQNIGIPAILNTQRVKFITENKKFNINKAKKILGYKANINLEKGMRKTYLWYKENNYL